MPAPRSVPLACPACRTRLRVEAALLGTEVSCPECASRLLIAADQQSVRLMAAHPLESPVAQIETAPRTPFLDRFRLRHRTQQWLLVGAILSIGVAVLIARSRNDSTSDSTSAVTEVAQATAEPPVPAVKVEPRVPNRVPTPEPVAPTPIVTPPQPVPVIEQPVIAEPVKVAVVAQIPNEPDVKPADQPPIAEPKPVDDLPARKERLARVAGHRISSFETSSKTPLRQLVREVNELAAGLIVIDESVSASDLAQSVSVKQRDANVVELLEAMLRTTGLRVEVREDHISITKALK